MEKLKEENGDRKEAVVAGAEGLVKPLSTPVGGKVRDIQKMVSKSVLFCSKIWHCLFDLKNLNIDF